MHKFDIMANMPEQLSMSLGAGETTLAKLTAAYAMLSTVENKLGQRLLIVYKIGMVRRYSDKKNEFALGVMQISIPITCSSSAGLTCASSKFNISLPNGKNA